MMTQKQKICSDCLSRNQNSSATTVGKDVFKVCEVTFCKYGL